MRSSRRILAFHFPVYNANNDDHVLRTFVTSSENRKEIYWTGFKATVEWGLENQYDISRSSKFYVTKIFIVVFHRYF